IFEELYNKEYTDLTKLISYYMPRYLVNGYVKLDIKCAYQICEKKGIVDILRLAVAKRHHNNKKYEKNWAIFSEIDICKFSTVQDANNKFKFTTRFWQTIYILEEYCKLLNKQIDENLKKFIFAQKGNSFF
ncbi:11344_t:CDS:1, partial [Gigaspora margarita]